MIQHELKGVEIEVGLIERRASLALIEIAGYQKFKWGADALIKFGGFMVFGGNFGVGALKYGALTAFGVPGLAALPLAQAQGLGDVPAFGWGGDGRRTGARGWGDARRRGPPIHISPPGMSPGFLRDVFHCQRSPARSTRLIIGGKRAGNGARTRLSVFLSCLTLVDEPQDRTN